MNRCTQLLPPLANTIKKIASYAHSTWAVALLALHLGAGLSLAALAQTDGALAVPDQTINPGAFVGRQFPAKAVRGKLQVLQGSEILIDGKPERLAPGARIRGPQNTLVMTGALEGNEYVVNFVREAYGNVHQVWILTELEKKQKLKSATPGSNFFFSADADKPKADDGKTPFHQLPKFKQ